MAKSVFTLPADVDLDLSDDTLSIRYDGDVVLEQTLGRVLGTVEAGGDLTVTVEKVTGDLSADGVLRIRRDIDAGALRGREIHLEGSSVKCRSISAEEKIVIGEAQLRVDVIMAPHIEIHPDARGRVTVIQSHNERGPTKIKGGFSLDEYEELFGDGEAFLADRGLARLGGDGPAAPEPKRSAPLPVPDEVETVLPDEEDDDIDDPLSLSTEDLTPIGEPEDHELNEQLSAAVTRILACYDGDEVPPSVNQLESLVKARDYDHLRGSIKDVWNGLLGYHQQRGIRPHHQVTHAFNVIHGLLQPA